MKVLKKKRIIGYLQELITRLWRFGIWGIWAICPMKKSFVKIKIIFFRRKFASKRKSWFQLHCLVAVFWLFNVTRGFCFSSVMASTIWQNFPKNSKIRHIYTAQKIIPNLSQFFMTNDNFFVKSKTLDLTAQKHVLLFGVVRIYQVAIRCLSSSWKVFCLASHGLVLH